MMKHEEKGRSGFLQWMYTQYVNNNVPASAGLDEACINLCIVTQDGTVSKLQVLAAILFLTNCFPAALLQQAAWQLPATLCGAEQLLEAWHPACFIEYSKLFIQS